jgi:AraC-like DNA-binding protein
MLLSYYYSTLFIGTEQNSSSITEELQKLIGKNYSCNRVCILISTTPSGVAFPAKPALMVQAVLDKLYFPIYTHTINLSGRTLLILHYEREEDFSLWRDSVLENFRGSSLIAGFPAPSIADLPKSYADANRAAGFNFAKPDLVIALRTGNKSNAESLIRELLTEENIEDGIYQELEQLFRTVSDSIEPAPKSYTESWLFRQVQQICAAASIGDRAIDNKLLLELVDSLIQDPNLSLQYVAERFAVSVSLISKVFKEAEGVGFNHYINNRRMEIAKELLVSGFDIIAAAKMAGYSNDTTFRRLFKNYTGMTPSDYRQKGKL